MIRISSAVCAVSLVAAWAVPSAAQSVAIGGNPQGSLGYAIAAGVAIAASKHSPLTARAVGYSGPSAFMPEISAGALEMGTNSVVDSVFALRGTFTFEGKPQPNIRVAANLVPFQAGILVRADSDIRTMEDLRGRPFPTEYSRQKIAEATTGGMLATAGLTWNDIRPVPIANFARGVELLVQGKVDGTNSAPGSAINREAHAKVPVRFISLTDTPETRRTLAEHVPGAYFDTLQPARHLPEITEPVTMIGFPYMLIVGVHVSDEVIYQTVKALHGARDDLVASHGIFRGFSPERMAADAADLQYHPGAIKFYEEKGMWPPKNN